MVEEEILFPDACRCCLLEDKDMVYVFDVLDEFEMPICDLIARNGAITILDNDCYSKHICGNCLNDLAIAERFVLRCRKTNDLLLNLTKPQAETEPDIEKVSYVLLPESLLEDSNTAADEFTEGGNSVVHESTVMTVEAKSTDELQSLYCVEEDDGTSEEEIVTDQLGLVIANGALVLEGGSIVEEEVINVDEEMYRKLLQKSHVTADVDQSDDSPTEEINYEEHDEDGKKTTTIESDDECYMKERSKMNQFKYSCGHCGASFVTTQNYARHLEKHQVLACQTCLNEFISKKELQSHEQNCERNMRVPGTKASTLDQNHHIFPAPSHKVGGMQRKKTFDCSYCSKTWVSQSSLTAHLRTHTGERPFFCSYCPKRFSTPAGLDLHERRHSGSKPYTCAVCAKRFTESSNLKVHMLQHTREKPHVCTVCNRAFARVFLLQLHQRTHTGEKPYGCDVCGKAFTQQGDLAAHRRIHSGERPYVCSVCGKSFIKSTALTQHRKSHEKHLMRNMDTGSSFQRTVELGSESSQ